MSPDDCVAQALIEYQEATSNPADFCDLPTDIQRAILRRAYQIQETNDPLKELMAA